MGNSNRLLLAYRTMPSIDNNAEYEIMLSPQFYTLKREQLSVSYHHQAKKLAPSVLDNLLPADGNYEYYVFRDEDVWVFIAYDPEEIAKFLISKGLEAERVSKLYFAEQVTQLFSIPVSLGEDSVLSLAGDTATVVPKVLFSKETEYQNFSDSFRPTEGVSLSVGTHSIIGKKEAWIMSIILLLFALMFIVEGMRYQQVATAMQQEVDELLKDYPALQSQYARENIAQKYRKIDKKEREKREVLKGLSKLILPGVQLESLKMDGKNFTSMLKCPNEKSTLRVLSSAKERKYRVSRIGNENLLKIEGNL